MTKKRSGKAAQEKPSNSRSQGTGLDAALRYLMRFQYLWRDIGGVLALALALLTLLGLLGLTGGTLVTPWTDFLRLWLGWGSILAVVSFTVLGMMLMQRRIGKMPQLRWSRLLALEMAALSVLPLLAAMGGVSSDRAELGLDGGRIGWALAYLLELMVGSFWRGAIPLMLLTLGLVFGLGQGSKIAAFLTSLLEGAPPPADDQEDAAPAVSISPALGPETSLKAKGTNKKKKPQPLPAEYRKSFRVEDDAPKPASLPPRDERLPGLDLLISERATRPDERNINMTAGLIEKTLADFGIPAKVIDFQVGPTVTQFAVEPGYKEKNASGSGDEAARQKVRISQISSLTRDLALALSAERLRIQAPVPGRSYVGIEVPNSRFSVVRLRPVLEEEAFYKIASPLAIALGRDVSGQPVVADLAAMPHLLIAGTTGSGKSVSIAAFTTCLVMNNTPDDLRLVMVDPKMVELVRFNGLPHLYGKVETELERILGVLRWVVVEMERRYKLLEDLRARDIDSYNRKVRRRKDYEPMPRIVVLVDELADLMMSAPDQTEHTLIRLAQMARATGIHLVIATQRPSTDVVTGLIKANFPARLSFAVASGVDSRVILDTSGAEHLLGRGDMLFLPPEASSPIRTQGVIVTDAEVERVIKYWRKNRPSTDDEPPPWDEMLARESVLADRDNLVRDAIAIIQETQRASTSMIQRRLRVGYPRAARLMDELEDMGIVGPPRGGGREREVMVGPEDEFDEDQEEQTA